MQALPNAALHLGLGWDCFKKGGLGFMVRGFSLGLLFRKVQGLGIRVSILLEGSRNPQIPKARSVALGLRFGVQHQKH